MRPRILLPFDFSDTAERALDWAVDFQRVTGAPALHLVYVISSRPFGTSDVSLEMLLPNESEIAQLEGTMTETAHRRDATATAAVVSRTGSVGDIILDVAESHGADLIVMGSHGRTGVKRLLLGSVAEHVLRHAKCPVVTVRAAHPS
jgi:universal stress protein A